MTIGKTKKITFDIDGNGCFNCTSHTLDKNGYPKIMVRKQFYVMTRFVFEECYGEIPKGHIIRHKCDNPSCINPEHLESGTHKDNSKDMYQRNRQNHLWSEENPSSKLTENEVKNIRRELACGATVKGTARKYNVTPANIRKIRDGKTWRKNQEIKA